MNVKKYVLAVLAVFVVFELLDFLIHGVILASSYESLQSIWRHNMMDYMWVMYVTAFIWSVFFVYIFTKGYQNRGWLEGLRYGLLIGILMLVVGMFNQWAVYPLPIGLVVQWFIFGLIQIMICGVVAALIYRPKA